MSGYAFKAECKHAGLDPKSVTKFITRAEKLAKDLEACGLVLFLGGSASIRAKGYDRNGCPLVVATVDFPNGDGGDGACWEHADGLMRGE